MPAVISAVVIYSGTRATKQIAASVTRTTIETDSNPTSISQVAAQAALEGDQSMLKVMNDAFHQRHDFVLSKLQTMEGVNSLSSDGTFYIFPSFHNVMAKMGIDNDIKLAEKMLADVEVALVPGSAFGSPGHMRISFATDMKTLEKALERIGNFVSRSS